MKMCFCFFVFFSAGGSGATAPVSHGRRSEEDDMAYFEKRYQERASYPIYCLIEIYSHNEMAKKVQRLI